MCLPAPLGRGKWEGSQVTGCSRAVLWYVRTAIHLACLFTQAYVQRGKSGKMHARERKRKRSVVLHGDGGVDGGGVVY